MFADVDSAGKSAIIFAIVPCLIVHTKKPYVNIKHGFIIVL